MMDTVIIGGIAYAVIAILAARGGGFLRSCDDAMRTMMNEQSGRIGTGRTEQHIRIGKEALS